MPMRSTCSLGLHTYIRLRQTVERRALLSWKRDVSFSSLSFESETETQSTGRVISHSPLHAALNARIPGRSCFCQILVPQDPPHRGMYDKSVEAESPHVGGVWKFEKWAIKSGVILITRPG
ncbi:hypothetical protein TNCV_1526351 [Trichonephila clavipes]|nr:hypothetical protein TNCV_1526351 [Trichonephila clavipes]